MCRSRCGDNAPANGDGRPVVVADLTRDASVSKRDFGLDTGAMEEFAHSLLEQGWLESMENDLEEMNAGKVGHPFRFTDGMIGWANRLRHALNME